MTYEYCLWDIFNAVTWTSVLWVVVLILLIQFLFKKRNKKQYEITKLPILDAFNHVYSLGGNPIYKNSIWIDTLYGNLYKIEDVVKFSRSHGEQDVYILYREISNDGTNDGKIEHKLQIKNIDKLKDQYRTWVPTNKYYD